MVTTMVESYLQIASLISLEMEFDFYVADADDLASAVSVALVTSVLVILVIEVLAVASDDAVVTAIMGSLE